MKKTIQITLVLLFSSLTIFGQTKETKSADILFENLSYVKAADVYKKLAEKNPTEHVLKRLGDSYYNNVFMEQASEAYAILFKGFTPKESEYMFKYAQTLRTVGNFKDSEKWMKKFHKLNKKDSRGINFNDSNNLLSEIKDGKPLYEVTNLTKINTEYSDFGITTFNNTIIFASPQKESRFIKRTHVRNNKNFLDLYQVDEDKMNSLDERISFSEELNEKYHESNVSFSPDKKTIYFTRNNYVDGKYKEDKKGYNNLKILRAELENGKWKNITELPFNSNEYSVGHPSVSKDGEKLYFASNMPGSIGGTDIYYVKINNDGTFGNPQNLGPTINTEGREMFPFISDENILYFSSDGHFGIGALDVFSSEKVRGNYQKPVNLKAPVNSELDDFCFSINPITKKGYLSSNRKGGVGDDDNYAVFQLDVPCVQDVVGVVKDKNTQLILAQARVILKDNTGAVLEDTFSDMEGKFSFKLPCDQEYLVIATQDTYTPDQENFSTKTAANVVLELEKVKEEVFVLNENKDLIIKINPIYFDFDKSNIRPDAVVELEHIIDVMRKYPNLIIKSTSHTDARGSGIYNESLSDRRAKSTVKYIISRGISSDRLSGKGYGESQLTNGCIDNNKHTNTIKCTKDQHQANRRTEFVIVKM